MRKLISVIAMGAWMIIMSLPAHAYLDPGTGSALIQGLIAAVAAIGVTVKLYWHRIIGFFGLRRESDTESESQDRQQDE